MFNPDSTEYVRPLYVLHLHGRSQIRSCAEQAALGSSYGLPCQLAMPAPIPSQHGARNDWLPRAPPSSRAGCHQALRPVRAGVAGLARRRRFVVQVLGKNQTAPREAPLSQEAFMLIDAWLARRPIASAAVFTSFAGRGVRPSATPMSPAAVWQAGQRYAAAVGLAHVKPHDFRRFVGTDLAKRDIRQAQTALGHSRIETTAKHYILDELELGLTDGLY